MAKISSEKRFFFGDLKIEQRADGTESRVIIGYAATFESWSKPIYEMFIEKINRGAFDKTDMTDVIACFNHDKNTIVARTKSGTLKLNIDGTGLRFEFEAPNTTWGNDILELVRRGDISECSFRFVIKEERWTAGATKAALSQRELIAIDRLIDISLVVDAAYKDTEVEAARSLIEDHMNEMLAPINHEEGVPTTIERGVIDIDLDIYRYRKTI